MKMLVSRMQLVNVHIVVADLLKPGFRENAFTHVCMHDLCIENKVASGDSATLLESTEPLLVDGGQLYISRSYSSREYWFARILDRQPFRIPRTLKSSANIEHYNNFLSPSYVRYFERPGLGSIKYKIRGANTGTVFIKRTGSEISSPRLIDRIQHSIEKQLDFRIDACDLVRIGSGASLVADFGPVIARIPQSAEAIARCKRNYSALQYLATMDMRIQIPKPLCSLSVEECYVTVESRVHGVSLDIRPDLARKNAHKIFEDALHFLVSPSCRMGTMNEALFDELISGSLRRVMGMAGTEHTELFNRVIESIKNNLVAEQIATVVAHGDFKPSNFLVNESTGHLVGLIDWDRSSLPGLPLRDYLTFLSYGSTESVPSMIEYMFNCASLEAPDPIHRLYTNELRIGHDSFRMLSLLAGIRTITHFYDSRHDTTNRQLNELIKSTVIPALHSLDS